MAATTETSASVEPPVRLGLIENWPQFSLLVAINAFVGAMVGIERSILPLVGEQDFGLTSSAAVLSFIAAFGATKAVTNLFAGALAQRVGRRRLLIAGWVAALPVPLLIGVADSWALIVIANLFLGVSQGLAWSMTVNMKIDLVGPRRRGLALGINESAGYVGVALAAAGAGLLASQFAAKDVLVVAGLAIALPALVASIAFVRDTEAHVELEHRSHGHGESARQHSLARAFAKGTFRDRWLRSCSQAGLVNNLNDGLAWGLAPLFLAAHGASVSEIGLVAGIYPLVWGLGQLGAGALADRVNHKLLIVAGMLVQAAGLSVLALSNGRLGAASVAAGLLGVGTALVYPTLMAAVSDGTAPYERAPALGVYRFWRDSGYVVGALATGVAADALGFAPAIAIVAGLTAMSGLWALIDMPSRGVPVKTKPKRTSSLVPEGGNQ